MGVSQEIILKKFVGALRGESYVANTINELDKQLLVKFDEIQSVQDKSNQLNNKKMALVFEQNNDDEKLESILPPDTVVKKHKY
ncbi:hypothetical protein BDF21DRAFT_422176 [Thamnidium elegans]|nr:hypothetical protein BDF21DRAFT_422176 [Thamnidium elegans]